MLHYGGSGDHVAKSRVEFQPCRAAYDRRTSFVAPSALWRLLFPGRDEAAVFILALAIVSRSLSRTDLLL